MINLDFDSEGRLLGIEVLDASKKLSAIEVGSTELNQEQTQGHDRDHSVGQHRGSKNRHKSHLVVHAEFSVYLDRTESSSLLPRSQ